jgi:hypothetical protein
LKCLESDSSRDEWKEKLFDLCDNVVASQTMSGGIPISKDSRQTTSARQAKQVETNDEGGDSNMVALAQLNNIHQPPPAPRESIQPYRPMEHRIAASRLPGQSVISARPTPKSSTEYGGEHDVERPPAHEADAPITPPTSDFVPQAGLGDDGEAEDIQICGGRNMRGETNT